MENDLGPPAEDAMMTSEKRIEIGTWPIHTAPISRHKWGEDPLHLLPTTYSRPHHSANENGGQQYADQGKKGCMYIP